MIPTKLKYLRKNIIAKRLLNLMSLDVLLKALTLGVITPLYLRFMSKEEFGLFSYFLPLINSLGLILNMGLYVSQSKLYHNYKDKKQGELLFSLNIFLLMTVSLGLLIVYYTEIDITFFNFIVRSVDINYAAYRPFILLGVVCYTFMLMLTNYMMTSERIKLFQFYNLSLFIFTHIFVVAGLMYWNTDKVFVRFAILFPAQFMVIVAFYFFYIKKFSFKFNYNILKKALTIGVPSMVSALMGIIYNFSDKFFIELFQGVNDIAEYSVSIFYANVISLIFTTFHNVWQPLFFKEKDIMLNYKRTKKAVLGILGGFSLMGVLIWLGLMLYFFLGFIEEKYSYSLYVMPIIIICKILSSIQILLGNFFIYFSKTNIIMFISIFSNILNLILNFLFIPHYGQIGAALATLLSISLSLTTYFILIKKELKVKIKT